jgi:hypothetical protein
LAYVRAKARFISAALIKEKGAWRPKRKCELRGLKRGDHKESPIKKMTAFQKAEALAGQRYDRDKLLAVVDEVTTHFSIAEQLRTIEDAGSMSVFSRCSRSPQWINPATTLERFREEKTHTSWQSCTLQ